MSCISRLVNYFYKKLNKQVTVTYFIPDGTHEIKEGDIPINASKVIIPYGVTLIGEKSFVSSKISSIEIPNSVTSISQWAFGNCNRLSSLVVPQSVTDIGKGAFSGCWSVKTIILPDDLTRINDATFFMCNLLNSIEIPKNVKSIGNEAFAHCFSILSIKIPTGAESLGNCVFYCCRNLTSIEFPNSLKSIGHDAFYECWSLVNIKLNFDNPNDVPQGFRDHTLNPSKIILQVPTGAESAYLTHPFFSKFKNIIPFGK